jgi:TonB family protein
MKSSLILVAATCLALTAPFLGQSTKSSRKHSKKDNRVIDVLSDTKGFDLTPYLGRLVDKVRTNWFRLIPESAETKEGRVRVRFRVMRNGEVTNVAFDARSGDVMLDWPAYNAIRTSSPMPSLPSQFACEFVELTFRFYYNPDPDTLAEDHGNDHVVPCVTSKIRLLGTSVVTVLPVSARVAVGSQQQFHATIEGAEDSTVTWSVGCEKSDCGSVSPDGLYTAPARIPNPPTISVSATLKATPTESASSTVTIVGTSDSP